MLDPSKSVDWLSTFPTEPGGASHRDPPKLIKLPPLPEPPESPGPLSLADPSPRQYSRELYYGRRRRRRRAAIATGISMAAATAIILYLFFDSPKVEESKAPPVARSDASPDPSAGDRFPMAVLPTDAPIVPTETPAPARASRPTPSPSPTASVPSIAAPPIAAAPRMTPTSRGAAEMEAVRAVLNEYRVAYESLQPEAVQAVWPVVDTRALGRAFDQIESQSLEFDSCGIEFEAAGAEATCAGRVTTVPKTGDRTPRVESRRWKFHLRGRSERWVIDRVVSW